MKKVLSLTLVFLLLFTMVIPAQAAISDSDMGSEMSGTISNDPATITIRGTGNAFSAYKLLDLTTSLKMGDTCTTAHTSYCYNYAYTVNDKYADVIYDTLREMNGDAEGFPTRAEMTNQVFVEMILNINVILLQGDGGIIQQIDSSRIRTFADKLYGKIKAAGLAADYTTEEQYFKDMPQGYYMFTETSAETGDAISSAVLDTHGAQALSVYLKESIPTLSKFAINAGTAYNYVVAEPGDTVSFVLAATIPTSVTNRLDIEEITGGVVPGWVNVLPTDDYTITISPVVTVYDGKEHPASVKIVNADGEDVPFAVTYNGSDTIPVNAGRYTVQVKMDNRLITTTTVTINKRPLTITTPSTSKTYTGDPITCGPISINGLVEGETITAYTTGSGTAVGTYPNTYQIDSWNNALTGNYEIIENLGTITITETQGPPQTGIGQQSLQASLGQPEQAAVSSHMTVKTNITDINAYIPWSTYPLVITDQWDSNEFVWPNPENTIDNVKIYMVVSYEDEKTTTVLPPDSTSSYSQTTIWTQQKKYFKFTKNASALSSGIWQQLVTTDDGRLQVNLGDLFCLDSSLFEEVTEEEFYAGLKVNKKVLQQADQSMYAQAGSGSSSSQPILSGSSGTTKTLEKLSSSGYKINQAADDAAGLSGFNIAFFVGYDLALSDTPTFGTKGNSNTATMTYYNDPYYQDGDHVGTTTDAVATVYSYSMLVNKITAEGNNIYPLAGAKFKLQKMKAAGLAGLPKQADYLIDVEKEVTKPDGTKETITSKEVDMTRWIPAMEAFYADLDNHDEWWVDYIPEANISSDGTQFTFNGLRDFTEADSAVSTDDLISWYRLVETLVPQGYNQAGNLIFHVQENQDLKSSLLAQANQSNQSVLSLLGSVNDINEELGISRGMVIQNNMTAMNTCQSLGIQGISIQRTADSPKISVCLVQDGEGHMVEMTMAENDSTQLTTSVLNVSGVMLPRTGGTGTTALYIAGSLLMLAAIGFVIMKKKKTA